MPINHTRIDERLIHGQVTVRWTKEFRVDTIVIANDEVAADEMQKMLLPMSAPSGVKVHILTVEEASRKLQDELVAKNVFLVVKRPSDVLQLMDEGVSIPEVNVGNMSHKDGTRQVKKSVSVSPEDSEAFYELDRKGVGLTGRMMPEDSSRNFLEYL